MKRITYILSIAFLTACGGEKSEKRTSENGQNINESIISETHISKDKNSNAETQSEENKECGYGSLTVSWDDPDKSGTNIRNSPNGKVIATITPADYPDGCAFEIAEESNGWFRIKGGIQNPGSNDVELPNGQGWIHRSVISVGTRNYGDQTIQILDSPENGKSIGTITKESYGLRILSICGSWVKISYKGISGWVSNEWICGIPWTTCS